MCRILFLSAECIPRVPTSSHGQKPMTTRYWIAVASRDHVLRGVEGGFCQVCHGRSGPLKRMNPGDWVIYYSSRTQFNQEERCQRFTAIGQLKDNAITRADMGNGFRPYRRQVSFQPSREVAIQPLVEQLSFIKDKQYWGAPFHFGLLEIPAADFHLIATQMLVEPYRSSVSQPTDEQADRLTG